jgi:hypothetical protein
VPNLAVAGSWTATGWPDTMESAVRSGRAAARWLTARWRKSSGTTPFWGGELEPSLRALDRPRDEEGGIAVG